MTTTTKKIAAFAIALGALGAAGAAHAGSNVSWSIGISLPPLVIGGGNAPVYGPPPVVYAPAPPVVYAPPPRVVYAPAPVVYAPPRVIYAPAPVVYAPPRIVRPVPVVYHPHGWHKQHERKWRHHRGHDRDDD